jgi:hypothetical protein
VCSETRDSHQFVGHRVSEDVVGILGYSLGTIRPNHCQDLEADGIDSLVGSQVSLALFIFTPGTDLICRILGHEVGLRPKKPAMVLAAIAGDPTWDRNIPLPRFCVG